MEIKIIDQEELNLIKEEWNGLLKRSGGDNVFLRWEWIHTWWDVFKEHRTLAILTAREEGRLVGVAPLYVDRTGPWGRRELRLCSDELYPDGLDIFIENGREKEVVGRIWSHILGGTFPWDVIVFDHLRKESLLLAERAFFGSYGHSFGSPVNCPYIKMTSDVDGYVRSHPELKRFSLKKKTERLIAQEHIAYKVIEDESALTKGLQDLFLIHDMRAKEKGITTNFTSIDVRRFHGELSRLFLKEKILRFHLLYDGNKAISAVYSFQYKNKVYCYQSGMDPEWKPLSAGMVVMNLAIERAFKDGLEEFDFLKGDEAYKTIWCDAVRQEMRLVVYGRTCRGVLGYAASKMRTALRRVKHVFDRVHPAWRPARNSLK